MLETVLFVGYFCLIFVLITTLVIWIEKDNSLANN